MGHGPLPDDFNPCPHPHPKSERENMPGVSGWSLFLSTLPRGGEDTVPPPHPLPSSVVASRTSRSPSDLPNCCSTSNRFWATSSLSLPRVSPPSSFLGQLGGERAPVAHFLLDQREQPAGGEEAAPHLWASAWPSGSRDRLWARNLSALNSRTLDWRLQPQDPLRMRPKRKEGKGVPGGRGEVL